MFFEGKTVEDSPEDVTVVAEGLNGHVRVAKDEQRFLDTLV